MSGTNPRVTMQRLYERLGIQHWSNAQRAQALALLLITIGAVVHHCVLFEWYIEDAAISFAYAKHLAMGEGLVPFIGGERVEGYSNPAWVFLLAPFSWFFDLHEFVKWLQVGMVVPTVGFTWLAAREILGKDEPLALVAPAAFAVSAQAALWGGAGLENGLMNLLMAAALWRSLVELRTQRWPWSAVLWLGVTLCRPEAILYAAVAGFCAMVFSLEAGRGPLPTLKWLATFFVPFGLYQGWRYQYFAWELPNTYYAKLERRPEFPLLDWSGKSWKYTRDFLSEVGWGFFLPVWALGILGHRAWRLPVAVVACFVAAITVELAGAQRFVIPVLVCGLLFAYWLGLKLTEERPPIQLARVGFGVAVGLVLLAELLRWQLDISPSALPTFDWMSTAPPYVLIGIAALLPLLAYRSEGWQGRVLTWLLCCAAIFFALIAQWDWMKGFRWYAPAVVPASVLFALGVRTTATVIREMLVEGERRHWPLELAVASLLVAATIQPNVSHTLEIARAPDTRPAHIRARVKYVNGVRERLQVQERFVDLDVDQGGHLYWSDFEMMDIAGLIEVPLSHHKFERPFVKQYLFEDRRPHFIHLHGGWASSSRILTLPEFRRSYVEIPGYVANPKEFHIGNHVRRDLVLPSDWAHKAEPVSLDGGVILHGVRVPSTPAAGEWMYVEIGISATRPVKRKERDDFRVVLFATNDQGALHSWEVAPGYDWIWPHEWKGHEMFVGKLDLRLPESLPVGHYDLGLVVMTSDGRVRAPLPSTSDAVDAVAPVFASGEVLYPDALEIVTSEATVTSAEEALGDAHTAASSGQCDEAADQWLVAQKFRPKDRSWKTEQAPDMLEALANCHARASDEAATRPERVAAMIRARRIDHWAPEYRARRGDLARELYDEGMQKRAVAATLDDWEAVFHLFDDAVDVDRRWSWARRHAEEARAFWLEIDEASIAEREAEQAQRQEENRKRREELAKRRAEQAEERAQARAENNDAAETTK